MPLHKEIDQPLCSLSSRPLLNRLNKKRVRIILRPHSTSNTNSCPIRRKPHTNHTPTIRNTIRTNRQPVPSSSLNSPLTTRFLKPNTQPLTQKRTNRPQRLPHPKNCSLRSSVREARVCFLPLFPVVRISIPIRRHFHVQGVFIITRQRCFTSIREYLTRISGTRRRPHKQN